MIALLGFIVEVLEAGWAMLVEFFPVIGRFFGRFGGWILGLSPWIKDFFTRNFAKGVKAAYDTGVVIAMETSVMVAWGWLISFCTSYFSGTGIKSVITQSPFTGFASDAMALVAAAFPIHFAVGLVTGYIVFRLSLPVVALATVRTVRWIFGA